MRIGGSRAQRRRTAGWLAAAGLILVALTVGPTIGDNAPGRASSAEAAAAAGTPTPTSTAVASTPTAPPEPTTTPTPIPTPRPDPLTWALLERALADRDWTEATFIYDEAHELIEERGRAAFPNLELAMAETYPDRLRRVDQLTTARDFDDAIAELDRLLRWYPGRPALLDRHGAIRHWANQLDGAVEWTDSVPHLFIHSLITDTDRVFDGDYSDAGYRLFMITQLEFERALEQLYANDYLLVDVHDLYRVTEAGIEATPLLLPAGKRPLVLSIDDVSYYDYMAPDGFPDRLEIDSELNVATVMTDVDGTERLTLDGDAMPILDRFVWDHPEFSLGGAKGIIALTGYEGVFGYDISIDQVDEPDFAQRRTAAEQVATRLRELGWDFASHSYTHDDALRSPNVAYGRFVYDSDRWNEDIKPVLGDVDLYISPFGFDLGETNQRLRYLVDQMGFNAFMPISHNTDMSWGDGYLRMYRTALDGYMLGQAPHLLAAFLDAETVIDEARFR